jgi:hypothetical protein
MPRLSRILRHGKHRGKQPVVIIVNGVRYVLQEPCPHCKGGEFGVYSRTSRYGVGPCLECKNGLVDTPMYSAIKRHLGIFDELQGSWQGEATHGNISGPGLPTITGLKGTLHFYPAQWHKQDEYDRGLCIQGAARDSVLSRDLKRDTNKLCPNCERIKKAREQGEPVVYE